MVSTLGSSFTITQSCYLQEIWQIYLVVSPIYRQSLVWLDCVRRRFDCINQVGFWWMLSNIGDSEASSGPTTWCNPCGSSDEGHRGAALPDPFLWNQEGICCTQHAHWSVYHPWHVIVFQEQGSCFVVTKGFGYCFCEPAQRLGQPQSINAFFLATHFVRLPSTPQLML